MELDMVVRSDFPASPFASALCQRGLENEGDMSESYRAPQRVALSTDVLRLDYSSLNLSRTKVQNWLRTSSSHADRSEESDNEESAVLNKRQCKQCTAIPEDRTDAASDASSVTEACAPPSTWGSDTEAEIFHLDWELNDFQANLPKLPKLKIPKSSLCPPPRDFLVPTKSK